MSEEEEQPKRPEFRVVDKRISARGDAPVPSARSQVEESPPRDSSPTEPSGAAQPTEETAAAPEPTTSQGPAAAPEPTTSQGPASPAPGAPGTEEPIWTPEQEAEAQRFIQEIGQRPSLDWVLNSAVTLANVAGTKLDLGQIADAQLAIDALAALVDKLGPRFGQAEAPLRQTLAQLQLAYAERSIAGTAGSPGPKD